MRSILKADDDPSKSMVAYEKLYEFQSHPPECFVAQIAFTLLNGFLMTTDGRLFSWGGLTHCIGREFKDTQTVGQISFPETTTIVKVSTGRSHVLALDTKGRVYAWGKNDYCQLGQSDEDRTRPGLVSHLKQIVQIYASENMSLAVDKMGQSFAWGQNKNNMLMMPDASLKVI